MIAIFRQFFGFFNKILFIFRIYSYKDILSYLKFLVNHLLYNFRHKFEYVKK